MHIIRRSLSAIGKPLRIRYHILVDTKKIGIKRQHSPRFLEVVTDLQGLAENHLRSEPDVAIVDRLIGMPDRVCEGSRDVLRKSRSAGELMSSARSARPLPSAAFAASMTLLISRSNASHEEAFSFSAGSRVSTSRERSGEYRSRIAA